MATVSITQMGPGDAVTVTEQTAATVKECVDAHGATVVGEAVITACDELSSAAGPLADLRPVPFEQRRAINAVADRTLGGIAGTARDVVSAYDQVEVSLTKEQEAEKQAAQTLMEVLFPDGTSFLRDRWSTQYGITEMLLQRADAGPVAAAIATLGLGNRIKFLKRVHGVFGERMGFARAMPVGEDAVARWHQAMQAYVAAVCFVQRRNSELREQLMGPYNAIAEAIRAKNRQQSRPSEVEQPDGPSAADA